MSDPQRPEKPRINPGSITILDNELLAVALVELQEAVRKLESLDELNRTDMGDIRMTVTGALAKINLVERMLAGVLPPKVGDG